MAGAVGTAVFEIRSPASDDHIRMHICGEICNDMHMTPLEDPPPYRPGVGSAPSPLFGREEALDHVFEGFRSADHGYGGSMVRLVGLRGTG